MIQISKLNLTNFRNFTAQKFEFAAGLNLLVGVNGVGKTNVLEGLTLLGKSGSLRGSDFDEMIKINEREFAIFSEISQHEFIEKLAVAFDLEKKKKLFYVNDEALSGKRSDDVKNYLINFISLTPKLEQLFISGKSERRDYLDKIVSDINLDHQSRINNYQKLLRERLLILQKYRSQNSGEKWLSAIESQIAETAVAIAFSRIEAIDFFNRAIASFASNFPKTKLQVIGEIEDKTLTESAVRIEEFYRQKLAENRALDLESFKTNFGVHRCDFDALFIDKNMSALRSSTGEQKAIMISITLARAKISAAYKNQSTILIFDEVVSHLDEVRKENLFAEISATNLQSFLSATSADLIPQKFVQSVNIINI
jgi:DNA replication and repair protein RecF